MSLSNEVQRMNRELWSENKKHVCLRQLCVKRVWSENRSVSVSDSYM
jgi:hypothetical protein